MAKLPLWALAVVWAYDCFFEAPDGVMYDLSALTHYSPPDYTASGTGDEYEYRANVCRQVFQSCGGDFTGIATQWFKGGACVAVIGRQNPEYGGLNRPSLTYLNEDDPKEGVSITYKNGDLCSYLFSFEREVRYNIRCDKDTKGELVSVTETEMCVYVFEYKSKAGCVPGSMQAASAKANAKRKWTVKRVLLWASILMAAYCLIGCYLNHRQTGASWLESVPHKGFWGGIPDAVRDALGAAVVRLKRLKSQEERTDV